MRRLLLIICLLTTLAHPKLAGAESAAERPTVEAFEDKTRAVTIDQVLAYPGAFPWRAVGQRERNFGYSASRFWFRFRVPGAVAAAARNEGLYVEIHYTYLARVDLFGTSRGQVFRHVFTGTGVPLASRDKYVLGMGTPVFRLIAEDLGHSDAVYYASAESSFPVAFPLEVYSYANFARTHIQRTLLLGAFFGLLLLAAVSNGFLAASLRSRLYAYYAAFAMCMLGLFLGHEGYTVQYLWPNSPWWTLREMHVYGGLALVFYALFVREFLERRGRAGNLDRALFFLVAVSSVRTIWLLFSDSLLVGEIGEAAVTATNLLVVAMGAVELRRGLRSARYFVLASGTWNIAMILFVAQTAGFIWIGDALAYAPHVGTALEVILLGFALADRIRATNQALAEERLASAHSDKLRALGRMAGEIAHEINNPLAIIHGNAVLMRGILACGGDIAKLSQSAATVEHTAHRISRIVKGMRLLSRDSRNDPMKETSLSGILQDTFALCEERVKGRGIDLTVLRADDLVVRCRPSEICQVLTNLLSNAFDAVEGSSEPRIKVEVREREPGVEVAVVDNGPGVPKELRARILEPFFSTKEPGKGLGLGLSISRTIVESHGGALWLDESARETRFVFTIPVSKPDHVMKI